MSMKQFDDNCPGCRPVLVNAKTGKALPEDSPTMRVVLEFVWAKTTPEERRAFHRFTCLNSRDGHDVAIAASIARRIEAALKNVPCN